MFMLYFKIDIAYNDGISIEEGWEIYENDSEHFIFIGI